MRPTNSYPGISHDNHSTIPIFIGLSCLLLYSLSWFTYLVLAQADAPTIKSNTSRFLPFLPYAPAKCVKVTWASLQYSLTATKLAFPALLDWSYRRVMILGTAAGSSVVREGILYGSSVSPKRLDVYLPPNLSSTRDYEPVSNSATSKRSRKHSTNFDEPPSAVGPDGSILEEGGKAKPEEKAPRGTRKAAPVIVFLPSSIPPFSWSSKRKAYLQLALRLRRMGNCVVIPDITYFPEDRIKQSVSDVREVLRWVGQNISRYGGDPQRIHLMGHGLSSHLALLTLTQEAVVLSREGLLEAQADREQRHLAREEQWQQEEEERKKYAASGSSSPPRPTKVAGTAAPSPVAARTAAGGPGPRRSGDGWVDDSALSGDEVLSPGIQLPPQGRFARGRGNNGKPDSANNPSLGELADDEHPSFPRAASATRGAASAHSPSIAFPTTPVHSESRMQRYLQSRREGYFDDSDVDDDSILDIPIPNGLRRVEIYSPQTEVPPVAGLILLSGISDVIKGFRNETERGIEDLSVLRRSAGPSHTSCLLHSPAHLLYASKNLLNPALLPAKVLLIHGGKDAVVPIEQSTLLKTLLVGIGVQHVKLRAYRHLGHAESVACLFLGMGKGLKRYQKMICQDLDDFLAE